MISPALQDALNAQINLEQYTAQLYLAMSAHLNLRSYKGFAHWLRVQAQEESEHAAKLIDFVQDRYGRLELHAVAAPPNAFDGPTRIFEAVLAHEQENTESIGKLFDQARREGDQAAEIALQWYVTEQVQEELRVTEILDHLRAIGEQGGAIWYLDHQMGKR